MDGNKDDAVKCFRIGKEALEAGNLVRALKFINKARRLDPTLPVDDLLPELKNVSGDQLGGDACEAGNGSSGSSSSKSPEQSSVRRRVPVSGSSESSTTAAYTEEHVEIVRQIKKKKDYYEILGLEKSCSIEDVRKSYRKLSLKVHPDKNNAPGAEEAFKAVSKAFQCLTNEESRRRYDVVGSEEEVYERRTARHGANGFNGFYDGDVDAEEIFRNFFFGGRPPTTTHFRSFNFGPGMAPRTGDQGGSGGGLRTLVQLLPVLLILLLSFMPSSEPIYALSRSYPYEHRFTTQKSVNFYVKSKNFEQDFPPNSRDRLALEQRVDREYFNILAQNCRLEVQRRQWGFIRETPHCDMLNKFQSAA